MSPDFLVIGAGVAGLRAAIELASAGRVLVVAKDTLRESSSEYAQGGIAVALSDDDEVALHEQDTLVAGDGLCDPAAVRTLVEEGPAAIQELIEWGAEFDRVRRRTGFHARGRALPQSRAARARRFHRAGKSRARSTAAPPRFPISSSAAFRRPPICWWRTAASRARWSTKPSEQRLTAVRAKAVLLATGGLGCVYRETTNPEVATGDGVAMAWRAGAEIADIEFVQFHPTALHVEGAPRFLLSEALRGEGAYLRNAAGERFMERYHPLAELAPRDVVSRAIVAEMRRTGGPHVWLDITHRGADFVRGRFPRIYETCLRYGIDLGAAPAPVHPAAHYAMGGVRTDLDGRTNLERLYAAGEVACTGVHGANRLASNSLLEGVVFGARAARAMREWASAGATSRRPRSREVEFPCASRDDIRGVAWEKCGILRSGPELRAACDWLSSLPLGGEAEYRGPQHMAGGILDRASAHWRGRKAAARIFARISRRRRPGRRGTP